MCLWVKATSQKCFDAACGRDRVRGCFSRSDWGKVHLELMWLLWPDVVLPLQKSSCNGNCCLCEALALPLSDL